MNYVISIIALIISIMSYLDLGFSENLSIATVGRQNQPLDPLAFEQFTQEISGSKIQGGKFTSLDGNYIVDLENNINKITDGGNERMLYGKLPDGTFGLIVNDSDGNEIGRLNESGLTIQKGKISIQNDNNLEFINSKGIVSPNTFQLIKVYQEQAQTVTDTSSPPIIDLNGVSLKFTIQQSAIVLINVNYRSKASITGNTATLQFAINGVNEGPIMHFTDDSGDAKSHAYYYPKIFTTGTYRVNVRARVSSGTGTFSNILLSALILGK